MLACKILLIVTTAKRSPMREFDTVSDKWNRHDCWSVACWYDNQVKLQGPAEFSRHVEHGLDIAMRRVKDSIAWQRLAPLEFGYTRTYVRAWIQRPHNLPPALPYEIQVLPCGQ